MTANPREELRQTVAQLAAHDIVAARIHDALSDRRDQLIRDSLAAGVRVRDLVADTGLTRARIYQIRDGRR